MTRLIRSDEFEEERRPRERAEPVPHGTVAVGLTSEQLRQAEQQQGEGDDDQDDQ